MYSEVITAPKIYGLGAVNAPQLKKNWSLSRKAQQMFHQSNTLSSVLEGICSLQGIKKYTLHFF